MATFTIGGLTDDAIETAGAMSTSASVTSHDHDAAGEKSGLRYQTGGSGPPQGATITAASILFTIATAGGDEPDVLIYGDKSVSSAAFSSTASDISNRTKTTANVAWSSADLGAGTNTTHSCPSLVTVVQELVNQASWTASSPITFLIEPSGTVTAARDLQYRMYEYTGTGGTDPQGTYAPVLTVTWTGGGAAVSGANRMLMTGVG